MQTIIVILIVIAAAVYLLCRVIRHGPGSSCGCSCTSCDTDRNNCSITKDKPRKKNWNKPLSFASDTFKFPDRSRGFY